MRETNTAQPFGESEAIVIPGREKLWFSEKRKIHWWINWISDLRKICNIRIE